MKQEKLIQELTDVIKDESPDFNFVGPGDILEISSILGQRTYNNIIYTGKSGVGKTANLYGLVGIQNIDPSNTDIVLPLHMINRKLWMLNTSLVFDGNDEQIRKNLADINDILDAPGDNILVIEDANDFLKAVFDSNVPSIVPRLMSKLRSKNFQTIWMVRESVGADKQLEEVLQCHSDIDELFTVLRKEDPDKETIYKIALSRRLVTEIHHDGLKVTEDACKEVVDLTMTHSSLNIYQRRQPARTLRVLTSIASRYLTDATKVAGHTEEYNNAVRELQILNKSATKTEIVIQKAKKKSEILITSLIERLAEDNPSKLTINANKDVEIKELEKIILYGNKDLNDTILPKIHKIKEEINVSLTLNTGNVKSIFSDISGIPSDDLDDSEAEKVKNIAPRMKEEIYGQDPVIDSIASSIKRASAGLKKPGQPIGSFVMVGSSGVGKSFVAKILAKTLFNDPKKLKIFDMSEFMNDSSLSRLIGAAPGLVGYGAGGELLNVVRENPTYSYSTRRDRESKPGYLHYSITGIR